MRIDRVRKVADAVLLEGYALYPYRASSRKNHFRWAFGVLAPRQWSEAGGSEAWWMETQCLLEANEGAELDVKLRFLRSRRRSVERALESGRAFEAVDSLDVDGKLLVSWDEGEIREEDVSPLRLEADRSVETLVRFEVPRFEEMELVQDAQGRAAARVVRASSPIRGTIRVVVRPLASPRPLSHVSVRIENETPCDRPGAKRNEILALSTIATHAILAVRGGSFVSLLDPPSWARSEAEACKNVGTYPVLAGSPGDRDVILSSPIILYDHPRIAPESPGDFFDATEIDELLALRTSTLTDDEKREARATDARSAAIVDRVERMASQTMDRLHGAIRLVSPAEEMVPRASAVAPGARVRVAASRRRADAQDFLFVGQTGTVEAVLTDVDDRTVVAVTLDHDPAADLHRWYGRYLYYGLDEVEILPAVVEST